MASRTVRRITCYTNVSRASDTFHELQRAISATGISPAYVRPACEVPDISSLLAKQGGAMKAGTHQSPGTSLFLDNDTTTAGTHNGSSRRTTTLGSWIPFWEYMKGQIDLEDTIPFFRDFECYVCDDAMVGAAHPEVVYALFTKQIPVLCLRRGFYGATVSSSSLTEQGAAPPTTDFPPYHTHPLLTLCNTETDGPAARQDAIRKFFHFPLENRSGRVFVVEGGDGSGKQTQVALLCDRIRKEREAAKIRGETTMMFSEPETIDFPHDSARYGTLIRHLLSGKMGNIKQVNPIIFASLYGLNRHDTLPRLKYWMQRGRNVVLDRYMSANWGHQASKCSTDAERIAAIETLKIFETVWLGLPEATRVIYLNLPPKFALKAMMADTTRRVLDMHELAGIEYKTKVRDSFLWCCDQFKDSWTEVKCVAGDVDVDLERAHRLSREEVHEVVWNTVRNDLATTTDE